MKGLLKCYYGYQNRGDELLFFGVVAYVFDQYKDLTHLDVEVGDVSWMHEWCELNHDLRQPYKSRVRFVRSRTFSMRVADYDMIYLGGGEVLASKTRSFWHGGVNYLALFWRWIWSGRVVWLGGIETPSAWRSKLLYRMMLPYAREIVCREQGSYTIARRYTDKVVLYHDWAIDVLDGEVRGNKRQQEVEKQKILLLHGKKRSQTNLVDGWMRWVKNQLTDKGYDVMMPLVDKTWEIGRDGWKDVIDQYVDWIDDNTVFVGHSAGAAALVRWLGEHRKQIKRLILVAPGYIARPYEEGRISTQTGEVLKGDVDVGMRDLYNFEIQSFIKDLVQDGITVFTSNDEDRLLQSADKYVVALDTKHIILEDRGHFNGSYGSQNETFPELIETIFGDNSYMITGVAVSTKPYVLVNFIPKHTTPEVITQFHEWIQNYPDHQIINFPAEEGDTLPDEIVEQYGDRIQTRQRWDLGATGTGHAISDTLALFQQADTGFGQRLHFIIPCVYYRIPIFRLSYSEKVDKILQYFMSKEL